MKFLLLLAGLLCAPLVLLSLALMMVGFGMAAITCYLFHAFSAGWDEL